MADEHSPLADEIRRLIIAAGPMPVGEYMRLCLTHPRFGYYLTRDPIGTRGDFITAPEISQMFGELIGLWLASVWRQLGEPSRINLIELGPGRGTLMVDVLRAAKTVRAFRAAVSLHLVEISPVLQQAQERRLQDLGLPAAWHTSLDEVPDGPCLIVANEFIDTLPIHQAIKEPDGWHERVVGIASNGQLAFGSARDPLRLFEGTLPPAVRNAPRGAIFEWRSDTLSLEIGRRVRSAGAALVIDYGHIASGAGDTLQAVAGHSFVSALSDPGAADLTAHVDFEALSQPAQSMGARCQGPLPQRQFLYNLGIHERARLLKASAPQNADEIDLALSRLTAGGPRGMGELFKVLAIADPNLALLPGFEDPSL